MRGLAYRAIFIIAAFVSGSSVRSIRGLGIIMLAISKRMRAYTNITDARIFRRNSIEDARPTTVDANINIRSAMLVHTRRHIWRF